MAMNRSLLKGMGLTEEQADTIIQVHRETIDPIKAERDKYKADAERASELQKELDGLKNGEDFKAKYEAEKEAFVKYKAEIAGREKLDKVKAAYKDLLSEKKVGDKYIDSVMGVTDFSGMTLDEAGKLTNAEALSKEIDSKWGGFIATTSTQGAHVDTPPAGTGGNSFGDIRKLTAGWHAAKYGAAPNTDQKG